MSKFLFIPLFFIAFFSYSFGQENDSVPRPNFRVDFGLSGIISASSYVKNYNSSPSIGFDVKILFSKRNNITLESGLYLSSRNLFSNKNYFVMGEGCMTCDPSQYYLHSISLFYTDIPLLFQYRFLKTKRDAIYSMSGGILNSFMIANYVKYTEYFRAKKEFGIVRRGKGSYNMPYYDLSILMGISREYKKKYAIGLYFQKGIRKFDTISKDLQPGRFDAVLLKTTILFK
ncbi:MAG: hypothetical protein K8R85_02045 [Bacteroidetes bacterium]|nr:hypothetical protein [Bacteroidota bacterium]